MPGRLTSWKGQEIFIEAISIINKELGHEKMLRNYFRAVIKEEIYIKKNL